MEKLFEIATRVSTPLMLAGFIACAFFLILGQILKKNIFPTLTRELSTDIIRLIINKFFTLALIALIFGFLGFVLTMVHKSRAGPEVKVVTSRGVNRPKSSYSLEYKPKDEPSEYRYSLWPTIDYKLKNSGDEIAIVTNVTLEVLKVTPDLKPNLYFQLLPISQGDLSLRIVNLGWGPALNVEVDFLGGTIRHYLSYADDIFRWKGSIDNHVEISISAKKIVTSSKVVVDRKELTGYVKYDDKLGNHYEKTIEYDSIPRYPTSGWQIVINPRKFEIEETPPIGMFSMLLPSADYDILLNPEENTPSKVSVDVSQAIKPNEADRFQIVVASTRAAEYLIKSNVKIDDGTTIETEPMIVSVKFPRFLPNYFYREGLPIDMEKASQLEMSTKAIDKGRSSLPSLNEK